MNKEMVNKHPCFRDDPDVFRLFTSNLFCKFASGKHSMYILKIKGKAKIPDYIQLRDDNFMLLAYFRVNRPEKALSKLGLDSRTEEIMRLINEVPYGKMTKLEI